jgi:hypothetical protein
VAIYLLESRGWWCYEEENIKCGWIAHRYPCTGRRLREDWGEERTCTPSRPHEGYGTHITMGQGFACWRVKESGAVKEKKITCGSIAHRCPCTGRRLRKDWGEERTCTPSRPLEGYGTHITMGQEFACWRVKESGAVKEKKITCGRIGHRYPCTC